ncbi:hypothetical protein HOLleu_22610 [Holothuria leucospilota]|uniref:NACHT domain-containing protein n=1 Tax=Holothuria leucospilota TaxID=206669 RepID=A0A9Q1BZC7_HOLLE|nr:hypothetical protein HOLleu_22610 [Holothuria leucospilota]
MVNVSYESNGCGEEAILQCVAKDDYGLLEISQSQVRLFTGKTSGQTNPTLRDVSDYPLTQVKDLPFISCFKEVYERECRTKFLPWEKSVPVDILYAGCQCELTFPNGDTGKFSSKQVLAGAYLNKEKRVLIVGDAGYGKTMFAKQFVQKWIEEKNKENYIFFLSLKDVKENMKVSDILKNRIFKGTEVQSEDIEDLFQKYKCVFLLDGLHEMHFEHKTRNISIQDESISQGEDITCGSIGDIKVTIKELLTGSLNDKYKNVQVWVTSLDMTDVDSLFPKRNLKVKLNGLSESELREYIKRTCCFYASLRGLALVEESAKGNSFIKTKANTSQPEKRKSANGMYLHEEMLHIGKEIDIVNETLPFMHDYCNYSEMDNVAVGEDNIDTVWGLLDKNDIFDIFRETPHILILTIHVLSGKFARKVSPLSEPCINNMATLIESVITCLKDKYTEDSERTYPLEEFNKLKEKLAEIAIRITFGDNNSNVERVSVQGTNTDQVKNGLAMGVLIAPHSHSTYGTGNANTTSLSGLKFSHYIFQDYFTAYYFLQNPGHLEKKIKSFQHGLSLGYLKFSSLFPKQTFENICNALLRHNMYIHLICCLYERGDEKETERIGRLLQNKAIVIPRLASNHQREAVKVFLQACCDLGVSIAYIACKLMLMFVT